MKHTCPVCLFPGMPYPAADYDICPCCATEFGNDDDELSHDQLRQMWIAGGARWFFGAPAKDWNPWTQLISAGFSFTVPWVNPLNVDAKSETGESSLEMQFDKVDEFHSELALVA